MNKKVTLAIGLILALIAGGIIYLATAQEGKPAANQSAGQTSNSSPIGDEQPGAYVHYSAAALAEAEGTTRLLFFHAAWCPQCRELEADIKARGVPDGVTVLKVDYDSNQQLRQKYGVTLQTTLVKIDANGDLVKKFVAYDDPSLKAVKENLL